MNPENISKSMSGQPCPYMWWFLFSVCAIAYSFYHLVSSYRRRLDMKNLQEKVVLITGASSGLGEALAHSFYQTGCRLILSARREAELERVKREVMQKHKNGVTYPPVILLLDLSEINSLPNFVEAANAVHGHIDILINNAAIGLRGDAASVSMDLYTKVTFVNYLSQVALIKAVIKNMIERQSGQIVTISSVLGKFSIPDRAAYCAAKHALQAFCDTLRAEVADDGVNVIAVLPGYIRTSFSVNSLTYSGKTYGVMDENNASGMSPEHLAKSVLQAVASGRGGELIDSGFLPRCLILIRTLMPSFYFWLMLIRARNHRKQRALVNGTPGNSNGYLLQ